MVRVNIINPKYLADQHLIAEYNEILMLISYIKNFPETSWDKIPENYVLGKGHMLFFKNKLKYLEKRHFELSKEMKIRGFNVNKIVEISDFDKKFLGNWKPNKRDFEIITQRILEKIKLKPEWYRYYGENKSLKFFKELMKNVG